jgi:hypothetical protein
MYQRKKVATHAAKMWRNHRHRRACRNRSVGCVATFLKYRYTRLSSEGVGT